jgi:hypothetical protein
VSAVDAPKVKEWLHHYLDAAVAALDPVPTKQFILAGGEVPWDQCDCNGQVWARVVSLNPVLGPTKANGQPCVVQHWDLTMAIGVIRCVAVPSDSGKLPTGPRMTQDGDKAADDLARLVQAVVCDPLTSTIQGGVPLGAQGGCAGSEVTFGVRIKPCGCD